MDFPEVGAKLRLTYTDGRSTKNATVIDTEPALGMIEVREARAREGSSLIITLVDDGRGGFKAKGDDLVVEPR